MDTVTYPNADVQSALDEGFVCFRPEFSKHANLAGRLNVVWTPGLVVLDGSEAEHYKTHGFYPPDEFVAMLTVACGMAALARADYREAVEDFREIADRRAASSFHAQALYWLGVARYKGGDPEGLSAPWNRLLDEHPKSIWARKAGVLRPGQAGRRAA